MCVVFFFFLRQFTQKNMAADVIIEARLSTTVFLSIISSFGPRSVEGWTKSLGSYFYGRKGKRMEAAVRRAMLGKGWVLLAGHLFWARRSCCGTKEHITSERCSAVGFGFCFEQCKQQLIGECYFACVYITGSLLLLQCDLIHQSQEGLTALSNVISEHGAGTSSSWAARA